MALERQTIEKKDFPIGRRGYDPDAVDQHLHALADEIEGLKRSSRRRTETLASAASEQVRTIVEAAETSAAEIQRQAEEEAREIRADANSEARATREEAVAQAREYVGRASESTAGMLQRVDAMESELGALLEALRTGANRLNADLQLLEGNIGEVQDSLMPRSGPGPDLDEPEEDLAAEDEEPPSPAAVHEPQEPEHEEEHGDEAEPPASSVRAAGPADVGAGDAASEGARLIALNMALNGAPREDTDRYLAENFELSDRAALIDEVYASVED